MACLLGKSLSEIDQFEPSEIYQWQYYLSEPRGDDRRDYNSAQICQAIYTFLLSFSDSKKTVKLEDNLLKFEPPKSEEEKAEEATLTNIQIMKALLGKQGENILKELDEKVKSKIEVE